MIHIRKGFTLVELVVVITIVAILSAIWFVSYTNYIVWARDTNRITQLWKLSDSLQLYVGTNNTRFPLPDDSVTLIASGSTIWYQWYAWKNVLETLDYQNGWQDPQDDTYFTYQISKDKRAFQLMWFLEEDDYLTEEISVNTLSPNSYAADLSIRYPKTSWKNLWILLEETTNIPLQDSESGEVDVVNSGDTYKVHFSDTNVLTASWLTLNSLKSDYSCERILESGWSKWDAYYTISPWSTKYRIYCNMSNLDTNLMEVNWPIWIGDTGGFDAYSTTTNSSRVYGSTHLEAEGILWETKPQYGGWYYSINPISIDPTKTYRVSVWSKKIGTTSGTSYFGWITNSNGIFDLDGTLNNNPYFWWGDFPELDTWYLIVGYIHASSHSDTVINGWLYNLSSRDRLVTWLREFKFDPTATTAWTRVLHYNDPTWTNRHYFYDPRFEEINPEDVWDVKDLLPIKL